MSLPLRRTGLNLTTPFSFSCAQCLRCCRHKKIQVNPYEIARLAANRGLSTTDFIDNFTHDGGTVLNWEDDGACVFLNAKGCGVHPDRPLVCRLYPLGRHVLASGAESYSEIEPHEGCSGVYSDSGTISTYLDAQGARPFMAAADNYLALLWRLCQILEQEAGEPDKENAIIVVFQQSTDGARGGDSGFADVDAIVAAYCEKLSIAAPKSLDDRMLTHIMAVEAWAKTSAGRQNHENQTRQGTTTKGPGTKLLKADR